MIRTTFSPPKQKNRILSVNQSKNISYQRENHLVKKRMDFEKENYDSSNLYHKTYARRLGFDLKKGSTKDVPVLQSRRDFTIIKKTNIQSLPFELHFCIAKYLEPTDILRNLQYVNKSWNTLCNDKRLWSSLDAINPLSISLKYARKQVIAERRSKGMVFKAPSRITGENHIIRTVNIGKANAGHDDGLPTSILREISYLTNFDHPNITKIKEVEVRKEVVEICSEYHDYNMKDFIKLHDKRVVSRLDALPCDKNKNSSNYHIPLDTLKSIGFQTLKGLVYLHQRGIIHRNLKCDNILVTKEKEVKISDFALSRLITIPHIPYTPEDPKDRERSGREARRLWYRAPELLLRKSVYSFEIDMWSFGCLILELALGFSLFNGDTEIEQLFKIFNFVGSPNHENWINMNDSSNSYKPTFPSWPSVYFPHIAMSQSSEEYKALVSTLLPNRESTLKTLKILNERIGIDGLDLLWQCLNINPQKRPSAEALLSHKFFSKTRIELFSKYSASPIKSRSLVSNNYTVSNVPDRYLASYISQLRKREAEMRPVGGYLSNHPEITEHMRCVLIDWLIDVSVHFEVQSETLHYCINYIDRSLGQIKAEKNKLQLVGVTCMKIADVLNERSKEYYKQENATEYAYITADEYNAQQLIQMEKNILKKLQFKLNAPTCMHFLKAYISLFQVEDNVKNCAMFISDLLLMSYEILKFDYSLVASVIFFLACKAVDYRIDQEVMEYNRAVVDFHSLRDFEVCLKNTNSIWHAIKTTTAYAGFDAVYNKHKNVQGFIPRDLSVPLYNPQDVDRWFYTS